LTNNFPRCGFSRQFEDDEVPVDPELLARLARLAAMDDDDWLAASMDDEDDDHIVRWRRDEATGEWIREEGTLADFKRRDEPDWPLSYATRRPPES
jgi:hypothetical protein